MECTRIGESNHATAEVHARLEQIRAITTDAVHQAEVVLAALGDTKVIRSQPEGVTPPNTSRITGVTIPPAIVLTIPSPAMQPLPVTIDTSAAEFGVPDPLDIDVSKLRIPATVPPTAPQVLSPTAPTAPQLNLAFAGLTPPATPTLNTDPSSGITPPTAPTGSDTLLQAALSTEPAAPTLTLTLPTAPTVPTLSTPTPPGVLSANAPGTPPTTPTLSLPSAPTITIPNPPGVHTLALPAVPTVDIASLRASYNTILASLPAAPALVQGDWWGEHARSHTTTTGWVDTVVGRYASFVLTDTRLAELLSGSSTGIPVAVEDALRARAYRDVDDQALADEARAYEEFAARGFSVPSGPLLLRLDEVRQKGRDAKQKMRMDIFVQAAEWEIKNLQFAVQQGIQYEGQMRQHALALLDLDRQMATDATNALKALAEVLLAAYTAQVEVAKAKIAFLGEWTRLELAKLDIYKAEIEGEIAKGTLDKVALDAYSAQLQGYLTQAQIYKTQVDAELATVEAGKLALAAYEASISAYSEQVKAWVAEWGGYSEQVKANQSTADLYQAQTQAFATHVKALVDVESGKAGMYDAQMRGFVSRVQAVGGLTQAQASEFEALMRAYVAQVASATDTEQAKATLYQAAIQEFNTRTQALLGIDKVKADVFAAEVQAFAGQMQAEQVRAGIYDTQMRGYAAQIQADAGYNQSILAASDLELKNAQLVSSNIDAKVRAFVAKLDEVRAWYAAQQSVYQTNAQVYDTTIRSQATAGGLLFESTKVALEKARIELLDALERYKTEVAKATADAQIRAQLVDAAGRVAAQIASGALAAAHVSASIASNYGATDSSSCETSYNYSL